MRNSVIAPTRAGLPSVPADNAAIVAAIAALYDELDVLPPNSKLPIAPLGPIFERLGIAQTEIAPLTARIVENDLNRRRVLGNGNLDIDPNAADERLSGFLYATRRAARLYLNSDDPVVRRRFSIAHELGHYVLHFRPRLLQWQTALEAGEQAESALFDAFSQKHGDQVSGEESSPVMAPGSSGSDGRRQDDSLETREQEADGFAAALLMPEPLVYERAAHWEANGFTGAMLADRLAREMLASRWAMCRRLEMLQVASYTEAVTAIGERQSDWKGNVA